MGKEMIIETLNGLWTVKRALIDQNVARSKVAAAGGQQDQSDGFSSIAFTHMREVASLLDRIVALDGLPELQTVPAVAVGGDLTHQLQLSLEAERATTARYEQTLTVCDEAGDAETAGLVTAALENQREHIAWLEEELEQS